MKREQIITGTYEPSPDECKWADSDDEGEEGDSKGTTMQVKYICIKVTGKSYCQIRLLLYRMFIILFGIL